jgi:U3 small nucleolar RNA-associated protein MPP10
MDVDGRGIFFILSKHQSFLHITSLNIQASAKERPENSLLEQDLEFDVASKPAPVITEETTLSLEDLIKKRIAETQFDDVERKLAPSDLNAKLPSKAPRMELNDEKSKQSLAEVYEQDFAQQRDLAQRGRVLEGTEATAVDMRTEEQKREHEEIETLFKGLCYKLDALSNWYVISRG